jgi:hypothetical protein
MIYLEILVGLCVFSTNEYEKCDFSNAMYVRILSAVV